MPAMCAARISPICVMKRRASRCLASRSDRRETAARSTSSTLAKMTVAALVLSRGCMELKKTSTMICRSRTWLVSVEISSKIASCLLRSSSATSRTASLPMRLVQDVWAAAAAPPVEGEAVPVAEVDGCRHASSVDGDPTPTLCVRMDIGPEIVGVARRSAGEAEPPATMRFRIVLSSPLPAAATEPLSDVAGGLEGVGEADTSSFSAASVAAAWMDLPGAFQRDSWTCCVSLT